MFKLVQVPNLKNGKIQQEIGIIRKIFPVISVNVITTILQLILFIFVIF